MIEQELKELIITRYGSISKFAENIDIAWTTLDGVLKRGVNKANITSLIKICNGLNIDCESLYYGRILPKQELLTQNPLNEVELSHVKKYRSLDQTDKKAIDDLLNTLSSRRMEHPQEFMVIQPPITIPYFGHIASAGTGQFVYDDLPPEMIELEYEMDNMEVDYAIGVNGDSMEPTYSDGDILLIKKQERINIGDIGIFMIDGEAYVKELGNRKLISHNKKYSDISINESVTCLGKTIGKYIK